MVWSFTNISYPVEMVYTQHVGVDADIVSLRCNPQAGALPAVGTLTMTWGATTITLPNCVVDVGDVRLIEDGRYVKLTVWDRRKRWENAAPISGFYNQIRTGTLVASRQKTLRQLATLLLTALGEGTAVVTALPTNIYPPVSWEGDRPVDMLRELLEQYGYSVTLGFGAEPVTVVLLGTGAALSTTGRFVGSDSIDAKLVPRYVVNRFSRSVAQCRLILEAVGQELDGTWEVINSLTYTPAGGWGTTDPISLAEAKDDTTEDEYRLATGYVYRAYRVKGFANDTWNLPDGSGSITGLEDLLPIQNRVLDTEDLRSNNSYQPYRVFGRYRVEPDELAQPMVPNTETLIGDQILNREHYFDGENGILVFEKPIYRVDGTPTYQPADLWIECTVNVRNQTNFSWQHYEYVVDAAPSGTGYHTVKHDQRAETIVNYNSSHGVTGTSTNQAALNAIGNAWATAVIASYTSTAGQFIAYHEPKLAIRCDGAILQVNHILTCGEHEHAVNRTLASRFFEFDRGIPTRAQRHAHLQGLTGAERHVRQDLRHRRREDADD